MKSTRSKPILNLFTLFAFLASLLGSAVIVTPAYATTLTVTNASDSGVSSLRQMIADAAPNDTIDFDSSLSGGTIYLASTLTLSKNLTIDGSALAAPITISGDSDNDTTGDVRVFDVNSGVTATLDSLIITKGWIGSGDAGGINNAGTLTITNSTFSGNSAAANNGGGIYNDGTLTVTNSTFSGNSAAHGGGIFNVDGTLTVTNSTFSGNSAAHGGGIFNIDGTLTVTNSTFSGNSAADFGGGIYNDGMLTLTNSTFSSNSAANHGGGIYSYWGGTLTVTNSTFSGNSAANSGGGIASGGTLTVTNSTFSGNSASSGGGILSDPNGTLNYANTIIANSSSGGDCVNDVTIGTNSNNLVEDGSCSASLGGDPSLAALADNGGPTQTFALLVGSPAINAGDDTVCANPPVSGFDQRGVTRPLGAHCDIGALEQDTLAPVVNSFTATSPSTSLNIPITTFTASDDAILAGYLITESATPPAVGAAGWTATAPNTYPVASMGAYTLYPWAKDAAGHVSALYGSPATVNITCLNSITVTSDADSGPGSLRRAIADACAGGTILFDNALSGGTIHLASTLEISKDLTIDGSALATPITISGDTDSNGTGDVRVFYVPLNLAPPFTFTVTLDSLIVTKGLASGADEDGEGGAFLNHGTLTIKNSTFSNNSSTGSGGAIVAYRAVTIIDSTFSGNSSSDSIGGGGAIYNAYSLTIKNSLFSGNSASASGGGGGAVINTATATIANSTFTGNTATSGGAILTLNNLSITNSTISGNSAISTGGLDVEGNVTHLSNTIIANNSSSIIGSTSNNDCVDNSDYPNPPSPDGDGIMTNVNNLIEDGSCSPSLRGDPRLGPLADNGGPTQTHALLAGSIAIDAGDDTTCAASPVSNLDQRGVTRLNGAHCDIGSYELVWASIDVTIGGITQGSNTLAPGSGQRTSYPAVDNGPVQVVSTNGLDIIAALRVIWQESGERTSYSEMMGLPVEQLSSEYWFPWYNNLDTAAMDQGFRIANVDDTDTTIKVMLGATELDSFTLPAGESMRVAYPVNNGPIQIFSVEGNNILAALRVIWQEPVGRTSYSEMMGLPAELLSDEYWFPWYNNLDSAAMNQGFRIANVDDTDTTIKVMLGATELDSFTLLAGESVRVNYAVNDGPIQVFSVEGNNILAALRVIWQETGERTSYSEMMGLPLEQLSSEYWFPWYNNLDSAAMDQGFRIANVDATDTTIKVMLGATQLDSFTLLAGESVRVAYPVNNGPIQIFSVEGNNILAALRVIWQEPGFRTSYSEMMGLPAELLSTEYWFPWYNNAFPAIMDQGFRISVP